MLDVATNEAQIAPRLFGQSLLEFDSRNPTANPNQGRANLPNMLSLMFGQLVAHESGGLQQSVGYGKSENPESGFGIKIAFPPGERVDENPAAIQCCTKNFKKELSAAIRSSDCLPVAVSASDSFYAPKGVGCLTYVEFQKKFPWDCSDTRPPLPVSSAAADVLLSLKLSFVSAAQPSAVGNDPDRNLFVVCGVSENAENG